jgi:hypothetical protein
VIDGVLRVADQMREAELVCQSARNFDP